MESDSRAGPIERQLLVCVRCWRNQYPKLPMPRTWNNSIEDCFVCEQTRGSIYVQAVIEWRPLGR